ncbi:helicase-related protein [Thiocapsa roseopersicina]|uniref:SNF2 family N-terminal domain-containing protein n=1 Tax=Thiocapsa roseopersicina TaxID=1058 RepID=A0A1H3BTA9_THIRO|nr:helicase-related protein [Thiocapsa roseopersicina]SDX45252.1 SNF2 family N-terminal domain-containing protein [Thiocapsa roseopersicina]
MKLEDIAPGQSLTGIEPSQIVSVMATVSHGDGALQLIYKTPDGAIKERLLARDDEATVAIATAERPFAFDGDGEAFQLACEAKRIDLAFLFDPMMAVHSSNVDPLPHQITAVYEALLPRQPLRYVLADDPGAGKTIMAGLYIRELIMRADAHRILIVAPGSLVEQWRDELYEKFGLEFHVYATLLDQISPSGNPFEDYPRLIVRLDQLARNEELQEKLCAPGWDLAVFDEAHKLAAHYSGAKLDKTGRFRFAEKLGAHVRHLLLMTATPHSGKEEDFQLFLSLLDSDRFYGKFRDGVHKVDPSDLMRRMVKEELVKFDGTPLFPERRAYTVNYELSPIESALYEAVTEYVKTEMGKADQLKGSRKGSIGFALTALQRRLASSPEAIFQSLKRRRERLENRLRDEKLGIKGKQALAETLAGVPEDDDDLTAEEQEGLEETLIDQATAAKSVVELEAEIVILRGLEEQAKVIVASGQDRKWDELSQILQNNPEMRDAAGRQRKLIIFSEHRDTLNYLHAKIAGVLGNPDAIITIHGGTHRDERRRLQALFRSDPGVRVLVATDAAGEGVNLQNANLMVNYDLPWNPNRLEQRFGRIHRIGQQEVCHLWNLVAKETREGDVYHRLLMKLEVESQALKGRVFDILGEVFEETSLKDLLMQAIRYGDRQDVRDRLSQKIDMALDHEHLKSLLNRNALAQETMSAERLFAVKEEMDKAEARRLQPFFVRAFFSKALDALGGTAHPREAGRFEITHVPAAIRERDRRLTGRNRRENEPVLKRYSRICFERAAIQPMDKPGLERALLMHPGHPLMLSMTDMLLEQHANLLRQGAVLIDPADEGIEPALLFLLTHEIKSGDGTVLSKRLQFVRVGADGQAVFAGWAPHLDLEPLKDAERPVLDATLAAPWIASGQESRALALAAQTLVPEHYREVAHRRIEHIEKTLDAVNERLTKEIDFWQDRWMKLKEDGEAGKDVRLNLHNVERTIADLGSRLESRKKELQSMRHVVSGTPVVLGAALIVPAGLMSTLRGEEPVDSVAATFAVDAQARARIERIAMDAVRRTEEAHGCRVVDVSADKCGWDLTAYPPVLDGKQPEPRHIEVKGRVKGASTVTVTRNEMLYGLNQAEKFVFAIVLVDGDGYDGPYYIRNLFLQEPAFGVASVNYKLNELISMALPSFMSS